MKQALSPQDFLSVTRRKFKEMVRETRPVHCWFSVTEACDLRCKYCSGSFGKPLKDELTTCEVYRVLDNIADAGTETIEFGGGEPTLRDDFLEIVHYASREKNMYVSVNTHGQLLDKKYVEALVSSGVFQVKVSVDGLKGSHDWNRGIGTFEKCIQALRNCVEEGVRSVMITACISQLNYKEAEQMIRLAIDLDVDISMVPFLPAGRGKAWKDLMLTRDQVRDWQRYLFEQQRRYGWIKVQFENRYQICEDEYALRRVADPDRAGGFMNTGVGCITGIWLYCISASGKVVVGDVITPELEIGDLREQSLREIWYNSELANLLRDRDKLKGKCGRCQYRFVCGGCRRTAYRMTGDIMAADPRCWYRPALVPGQQVEDV